MAGQILVASSDGSYVIRLIGDVRMVLCLSFDKFINAMFEDSAFHTVVFDLRQAVAVDSTTLGLMAKIALRCMKAHMSKPVLLSESTGMLRLLDVMGFEDIFIISLGCDGADVNAEALECEEGTEDCFKRQVLDAHKVLMSLNEHNNQAFKALVESLEGN
ncbi:STAS domain-containing protein [Marinagarivorans algicola]|uniref:STAS domain-containing protein n=1 Tax=Marinagarivorans algicola TaxID=1513270 RepID=UPI0006B499BB|nr:STAS domain-containing protein [Marinagarivorans algicola]